MEPVTGRAKGLGLGLALVALMAVGVGALSGGNEPRGAVTVPRLDLRDGAVRARQRARADPAAGEPPAPRVGQPLVPRGAGQRGGGADRVRPPVRTHDVRGVGARRRRRGRPAAGGHRHVGERQHQLRLHELHRARPAGRAARAGLVAAERPDGVPARPARPGKPVDAAGRRPQRTAGELRRRRLRAGRRGGLPPAVPGRAPVPRLDHRLPCRHRRRPPRRRPPFLSPVLRAQQRQPRHRRRHRRRPHQGSGRAVLRDDPPRRRRPPAGRARPAAHRRTAGGDDRHRRASPVDDGLGDSADPRARRLRRHRHQPAARRHPGQPPHPPARQRSPHRPVGVDRRRFADRRFRLHHHRHRQARPHPGRARGGHRRRASRSRPPGPHSGRGRRGQVGDHRPVGPQPRRPGRLRRPGRPAQFLQPLSRRS